MPRGVQHSEEFERISRMEHNVAINATDMFGPSKRFEEKGQLSNPTSGGGINRPLKGKGKSQPMRQKSAQGRDKVRKMGSPANKGKSSPARKHHGHGG